MSKGINCGECHQGKATHIMELTVEVEKIISEDQEQGERGMGKIEHDLGQSNQMTIGRKYLCKKCRDKWAMVQKHADEAAGKYPAEHLEIIKRATIRKLH